jgi:hypothetical protein
MRGAYSYVRIVERGLAGVTDEFLARYGAALESLVAQAKEAHE